MQDEFARYAGLLEGAPEACLALTHGREVGTGGDVRDARAPPRHEFPGRQSSARELVGVDPDRVRRIVRTERMNDRAIELLLEGGDRDIRTLADHDDAVDLPVAHMPDVFAARCRIVAGVEEQARQILRAERSVDPDEHRHTERTRSVLGEHADRSAAPERDAARKRVRAIVELFRDIQHALARLLGDATGAVHDL